MAGFGTDLIPGLIAGKPKIPDWQTVSLTDSQTKAQKANLDSLPVAENIAGQVNSFNQSQLLTMLKNVIPGFDSITGKSSNNIQDMLEGKLPSDVSAAVQDNAAARSLTGGFGGSGLSGNLTARDLGLTSLDLTQKGLTSAQSWMASMKNLTDPGQFNVASMFITPQQEFQDTMENQTAQFQRDYVSNMNDYQHSFKVLLAKDVQGTANTLLSMFGGSMFGGMGGMGGSQGGGGGGGGADLSGGSSGSTGAAEFGGLN